MGKVKELRSIIYGEFDTEAQCARALNWPRQRLGKITNGQKEPDVTELNEIARLLGRPVDDIVQIFLRYKSPNRQHCAHNSQDTA